MVTSTTSHLADELWLEIGENITDISLLSSLCVVSRYFNALFTPLLYRRIWLLHGDWRLFDVISRLSPNTRLKYVRELVIAGYNLEQDPIAEPFRACFRKMTSLQSFT